MPARRKPGREKAQALRENGGLSNPQIASLLGVSHDTVRRWLGPTPGMGHVELKRIAAEKKDLCTSLRSEGLSNTKIAEHTNLSIQAVSRYIGRTPAKLYKFVPPNKLPESMHVKARELRGRGLNNSRIAEVLGVTPLTISNWIGSTPDSLRRKRDYSHLHFHYRAMYLRECGYTIREIAEEMNVPRATVGDWVRGMGCYGRATD